MEYVAFLGIVTIATRLGATCIGVQHIQSSTKTISPYTELKKYPEHFRIKKCLAMEFDDLSPLLTSAQISYHSLQHNYVTSDSATKTHSTAYLKRNNLLGTTKRVNGVIMLSPSFTAYSVPCTELYLYRVHLNCCVTFFVQHCASV